MADLDELLAHATPRPWYVQGNSICADALDDDPYVVEEVAELASDARLPRDDDALLIVEAVNSIEAYKAVADAAAALIADVPGYALRDGLTPAEQTRIDRLREALARVGHTGKETA